MFLQFLFFLTETNIQMRFHASLQDMTNSNVLPVWTLYSYRGLFSLKVSLEAPAWFLVKVIEV